MSDCVSVIPLFIVNKTLSDSRNVRMLESGVGLHKKEVNIEQKWQTEWFEERFPGHFHSV